MEAEAPKEAARRVPHLKDFLAKSIHNLQFDQISQQMLRHKVSSVYGVARLLELFENMLETEKEEIIAETVLNLNSAREKKRFFWNAVKTQRERADQQLTEAAERNIEARRTLNRLQSNVDSGKWKCMKVCEEAAARMFELQQEMNTLWPTLITVQNGLGSMNEILDQTRKKMFDKLRTFRKLNREARTQILRRTMKLSLPKQSNAQVRALADKLSAERQKTEQQRQALNLMIDTVGTSLSIDDLVESGSAFKEALMQALGNAHGSGIPAKNDRKQLQTLRNQMQEKLETMLREKEAFYLPKMQEQNARTEKLERELKAAEARLNELMQADSCLEPAPVDTTETSEVRESHNRTDQMMNILFSQGTMTLSEPIDSLIESPISKRP